MHELSPRHLGQQYIADARLRAFSEKDPYERGCLLVAGLHEGDSEMGGNYLLDAFLQINEETGEDPSVYYPLQKKKNLGRQLIETFVETKKLEEAYELAQGLWLLDEHDGINAYCTLLQHGYSGPNNELLHIYNPQYLMQSARDSEDYLSRQYNFESYVVALAEHGIDLTRRGSTFHELLLALTRSESDPWQQQRQFKNIAVGYAEYAKNIHLALVFKDKISTHTLKARTLLEIGEHIEDQNVLKKIVTEVTGLISKTASCRGDCDNELCDPKRDVQELQLKLSIIYARLGLHSHARTLLKEYDDGYHFSTERLQTHLQLYRVEGAEEDRRAALHLLNQITYYKSSYLSGFIASIAEADVRFGRTVPSLVSDDEVVPLIVWEIQNVFGQKDDFEKKMEDTTEEGELIRALIGIMSSNNKVAEWHEQRRHKQRSAALATLAIMLAKTHAPFSAHETAQRIEEPVDQVRAKVAFARIYGSV